jgi:peptidyl-prolyl cis-trans isomerase B (cyclophilin B)
MTDPQPPVPPVPSPDGVTPPPPPVAPEAPVAPAAYPAYGQPAAAGYYAPPTNTLAILALVLGFVVPLGGIICGHLALGQIKRTGEGGHGLAMAGLIIGYVLTGLTVLIVIGYIIAIVVTLGAVSTYSSY